MGSADNLLQIEESLRQVRQEVASSQAALEQRTSELATLRAENAQLQASLADVPPSNGAEASSAVSELEERIEGECPVIAVIPRIWRIAHDFQSSNRP